MPSSSCNLVLQAYACAPNYVACFFCPQRQVLTLIMSIRLPITLQDEFGFSASQPPVPTAASSSPSKSTGCETITGFLPGGFGHPSLRPLRATPPAGDCLPEAVADMLLVPCRRGSCGGASASSLLRAECKFLADATAPSPPCRGNPPTEPVDDRTGSCGLEVI